MLCHTFYDEVLFRYWQQNKSEELASSKLSRHKILLSSVYMSLFLFARSKPQTLNHISQAAVLTLIFNCIYIYIYNFTERERERLWTISCISFRQELVHWQRDIQEALRGQSQSYFHQQLGYFYVNLSYYCIHWATEPGVQHENSTSCSLLSSCLLEILTCKSL